ncbi:MAG TPA: carboxypeptidase-like regulatory domain-containing protein [Puia sp.]|nr:carboxypeptidase-like regulatory domain-containing protein [Puia sp.]
MNRYSLLFTILIVLSANEGYSQNARTISGQVKSLEDGMPLEGVVVKVKGTDKISGSQQDGAYYIPIAGNDSVLLFSLDEYQTVEVKLSEANEYNIVLRKEGTPAGKKGVVLAWWPLVGVLF